MSDHKIKPAAILLASGVVLGVIVIALAIYVFATQKPAPTQSSAASSAAPSTSAPATVAASAATAGSIPNPADAKGASTASAPEADQAPAPATQADQDAKAASSDEPRQPAPSPAAVKRAQTIDCSNPVRNFERIICSDDELLELDAKLAGVYRRSRARSEDPDYVRDAQRDWERKVRNVCENDTCLVKAYKRRIAVVADPLN